MKSLCPLCNRVHDLGFGSCKDVNPDVPNIPRQTGINLIDLVKVRLRDTNNHVLEDIANKTIRTDLNELISTIEKALREHANQS